MNYRLFYQKTYEYLLEKASLHNVTETDLVEKYFKPFPAECLQHAKPNTLDGVFYRMAFHLQNATMKKNVVDFKNNYKLLHEPLLNFDFREVLNTYQDEKELYKSLSKKISKIKYVEENFEKTVGYKYAKSLYASALFLSKFNSYEDLINCFLNLGDMLPLFLHFEIYGFGIALACDFVKELDSRLDFAKPDIHIKEIILALGLIDDSSSKSRENYQIMVTAKTIASEISLATNQEISTYMLDKIWWLISTETFYHHDDMKNTSNSKRKAYLEYIKQYC